jgi:anti-sigma regulatory factor (Ser/Thr protein kinase)/CheY-like chemotaxis protein
MASKDRPLGRSQMATLALQSANTQARPHTALIVGSENEVNAMLRGVLEPFGWIIRHVCDNSAALALAQAEPFEVVVTSDRTSTTEDIELLGKIRRARPHIRLIILTDDATPAEVVAAMRARAFSLFSRPFSMESLAEMVRLATHAPCWDDGIEVVSATPTWIRLMARCDRKTADRLVQFIRELADDLPGPELDSVANAFRELLLNAMEHGANFDENQYVEIGYLRTSRMVVCRIKDPGEGFSLEELLHAAISNPSFDPLCHLKYRDAAGLRPGGYGIMLAKHLVDDVIYGEHGNEVLLIKYLAPVGTQGHHS